MKKMFFLFLFMGMSIYAYCQNSADKDAIIKLLEKESATWRSGDVKEHADCWYIEPYSRILVSAADGSMFDVPPQNMIDPAPGMMGKGGTSANSNYKMSIHGNDAWVSHDEESTATDGKKSYSSEIRILEKIKGRWKLVAQSIHLYNRK